MAHVVNNQLSLIELASKNTHNICRQLSREKQSKCLCYQACWRLDMAAVQTHHRPKYGLTRHKRGCKIPNRSG